ncbi:MAG: SOS-response transcriptional repressor, LexA [Actinomycetia bacterium]|nr:SOS-response transcriptional repressor, LexA [Actinomycetes bacterium]
MSAVIISVITVLVVLEMKWTARVVANGVLELALILTPGNQRAERRDEWGDQLKLLHEKDTPGLQFCVWLLFVAGYSRILAILRAIFPKGKPPVDEAVSGLSVPLVGRLAAGKPMLAEENIEDHILLGPEIVGGEGAFALYVRGDSMIGAGIQDGDIVVVRPQGDPINGQIVVARIENEQTGEHEVTVKRFFREAGRIRLQPENEALQPIYARDLHPEGVVVAVVRVAR